MDPDASYIEQLRGLIAEFSEKAASAYAEAAPAVLPRIPAESARQWVALGCALARESGAAAVKFFRESPDITSGFLDPSHVAFALKAALRLAGRDYGVALEFFRQSPLVLARIGPEGFDEWSRVSAELGDADYATAIEFLKSGPLVLECLPASQLQTWAHIGLALAREDLKTKDFLSLDFFRVSPDFLSQVPSRDLYPAILQTALQLTRTSGKAGLAFLKSCPPILTMLNRAPLRSAVLEIARSISEECPTVVPEFMGHCIEALALAEGSLSRFQAWAKHGIDVIKSNPERAATYFALQLKTSRDHLRRTATGIYLKDIARTLRLYAEGLSGKTVEIKAVAGPGGLPTTPEGIISLPEQINLLPDAEDNFRFYKVMTFHEAGHLEYGSFEPVSVDIFGTVESDPDGDLRQILTGIVQSLPFGSKLNIAAVLQHFPDPALAKNLWTIVEEGRIDFRLRHDYAGIRTDMDRIVLQQMRGRPKIVELPIRQAILEALLQLSVADDAEVPLGIVQVVSEGYKILRTAQHPNATVDDSMRAVCALYGFIQGYLKTADEQSAPERTESPADPQPDLTTPTGQASIENLSHRNPVNLERTPADESSREVRRGSPPADQMVTSRQERAEPDPERQPEQAPAAHAAGRSDPHAGVYYYDEWDFATGDYRANWCRLEEKDPENRPGDFSKRVMAEHGSMIALLRRHFEYLRPQAFKKIKKQEYGEEIDLEAAIESVTERRAGLTPSGRVYSLRQKKTRDVSVALLIDLSGSTNQHLLPKWSETGAARTPSKRVIDIEMESLVVLGEALDALGDEFAIFGFSGHSRHQVNFYRIKDFEAAYTDSVRERIGALQPGGQNRDGTAIRHVTDRLMRRSAKAKLFILLSDGKPLDEDYSGLHSLEDTRMALREARTAGIHPFCITVDRDAPDYIAEMYDRVSYTIISNIATLPHHLPRIYKRLTT